MKHGATYGPGDKSVNLTHAIVVGLAFSVVPAWAGTSAPSSTS